VPSFRCLWLLISHGKNREGLFRQEV